MKNVISMVVMLFVSVAMFAQVTTSSISGKVTDSQGEVVGATVVATHVPSGTVYGAITNIDGRYTIQGLRAGGPYSIKVSFVGLESNEINNVTLQLGETFRHSVKLEESSQMLAETVVVGNAMDANKTGASMHMSAEKIEKLPTINHSIADVVRYSPQVRVTEGGAMYFAGTNNRYNSFQVDGAMNNDVFGLTANGSNGGLAGTNPISMETIEQIQVQVAPYDVTQGGFTGGSINAITKSGTNDFHGSVYWYYLNQGLIGKSYTLINGKKASKLQDQSDYTLGVTFGGPIVKDKLFFFGSYEHANSGYDNNYGIGAAQSKVDAKVASEILDYVKAEAAKQGVTYNGSLGTVEEYTKSDKASLKLDWNITDRNHAALRWSMVNAGQINNTSGASSLCADTYSYEFESKTNSFAFELHSRIGDNKNNEFHATYVRVRDKRNPSAAFPMISISNVGNGTLNLGNERSSMANGLDQDIFTFTDNFSWYLGSHTIKAGTHDEFYKFSNLFIQDLYGSYYYNSVEDFYAGKINRYRYGQANEKVTGDPRWAASFGAGQLGFYVQDKWNVTDNFDVTLGLRADMPLFFDTPAENAEFNAYAAEQNWGTKTNQKLSGAPMWSPRLGFHWDVNDNRNVVLRGGVGIFTGRVPFVWLSNNFSNTGIQLVTADVRNSSDVKLILNPNGQAANLDPSAMTSTPDAKNQTINVFDKDFRFAQSLRANLALDVVDPAGIKWTLEGIYSKTLNDLLVQNLNVTANGKTFAQTYTGSTDNRPMFQKGKYNAIYYLTNTDGGYSVNFSLKGDKSFENGLDLSASYTFTHSEVVNPGTSSVAASNWQYNYTHNDPNNPGQQTSCFNIPHQLLASVYYHIDWNKNAENNTHRTTVGLVYRGTSGVPYTVYVNGDVNGDGGNNDLFYIPTDSEIDKMVSNNLFAETEKYSAQAQAAGMKAWIAGDKYMKNHRGKYFEGYDANEDFENHFDFHFDHKYGFKLGSQLRYLTFSFDIMNIGNMFNDEWGRTLGTSYNYYSPVSYSKGQYQFLHDEKYNMRSYTDYYSRWRGQIGLKFTF